jgi:hypothetical protein
MIVEVTLGGRQWKIDTHAPIRKVWGYCHFDKMLIQVSKGTHKSGKYRDVLIHECLHAIYPFLSEDAVNRGATELDRMLDKCMPPTTEGK